MKRKSIYKLFIIISTILINTSCETIIDFDGETKAPLVVLNSILQPDSVVTVQLTKSKFFLSVNQNYPAVKNATVKIVVNGNIKETLTHLGEGFYKSNTIVKENDKVEISAEVPGMDIVKSEAMVLPKITIISVDTIWKKIESNDSYSYYNQEIYSDSSYEVIGKREMGKLKLKVKFRDNSATKNYYQLNCNFSEIMRYEDINGVIHEKEQDYFSYYNVDYDDLIFGNTANEQSDILDIESGTENNFFTDELINGKEYTISLSVLTSKITFTPGKEPKNYNADKFKISISLDQLSRDYYLYQKTVTASVYSNSYFSEPIQIHNNIVDGIGIFGSTSRSVYKIKLKDITPDYYNSGYY